MADNEPYHFAPHVVAGMVDIGVQSVRRWAEYHKAYLSESANPKAGEKRAFTWDDVETFKRIKTFREEGLSVEAINIKLSEGNRKASKDHDIAVSVIAPPVDQESHQDASALTVYIDAVQTLQRRVDAMEASTVADKHSRRDYVQGIAVGAIGALVFVMFLLLLFLLRHYL